MSETQNEDKVILEILMDKDGQIKMRFGGAPMHVTTYAMRLAEIELNKQIVVQQISQNSQKSNIVVPKSVLDRLK